MANMTLATEVATATAPTNQQSLLDRIVEQQAQTASRYLPVMTVEQTVQRKNAIQQLKNLVLVVGVDYGAVPGTDKPTLLKPGAEKICAFFGYVPSYEILPGSIEDWGGERHGEPLFYYHVSCTLSRDGVAVGAGAGSCSNWENKYRYRSASRKCPKCGKESIIAGREEYGGGWLCFAKKGGCGAKFPQTDQTIVKQEVGQVKNQDFADILNTIQKMADKRAYVAATLSATGASQWFTQDVEDAEPSPSPSPSPLVPAVPPPVAPPAAGVAKAAPAPTVGKFDMVKAFGILKKRMQAAAGDNGELRYYDILLRWKREKSSEFNPDKPADVAEARACYAAMKAETEQLEADAAEPIDKEDWVPEEIGGAK